MKHFLLITLSVLSITASSYAQVVDDIVCAEIVPPCILDADGSVSPAAPYNEGLCADKYQKSCELTLEVTCGNSSEDLNLAIAKLKDQYYSLVDKHNKLEKRYKNLKRSKR